MPINEQEKKNLATKKALLEQKEMQTRINKEFEVEKPVKKEEEEEEEKFYVTPLQKPQNKEKEITNEEEPKKLSICWRDVCIPISSMDLNAAQEYCDTANELLNSKNPEDRLLVEKAWDLLANGKEQKALNILQSEIKNKRDRDLELMPMKDTATISMKERLRDFLPQKSDAGLEESTLPNPCNTKLNPKGFV